ncbi:MAG TPA: lipocalin-like domain-containing protein [Terriglobales bacterium]|nr:lipocalin-like domain-containing protein [Terriglobales bacterium]
MIKPVIHLIALACCLLALPGYHWQFPRDDGPHADFATEWWYFTGNLTAADGHAFGFELTFFRVSPERYFTHFSVSDVTAHSYVYHERAHRGQWGEAGIAGSGGGQRMWDENWEAGFDATGPRALRAAWGSSTLELALVPGPRMLNGDHGYSQKGDAPGEASYYYSLPHVEATGTIDGHAVTGLVWMDHEFSSSQLSPQQQGWNWMGLHLAQGDLMLFDLRRRDGHRDAHSSGTFLAIGASQPERLQAADFQLTPLRRWNRYPVAWRLGIPKLHIDVVVNATLDDQEFHAAALGANYWEGAVTVSGSSGGSGYLEMTGYDKPFNLLTGLLIFFHGFATALA